MARFQPATEPNPYADRRGSLRYPVQVDSIVSTCSAIHRSVTLVDISAHGCQIHRPDGLDNGTQLSLSFGGFTPFDAKVVWTISDAAGLRFEQPIHTALVASVVAAAKGRRRSKAMLPGALIRRADRAAPDRTACRVQFEIDAAGAAWAHAFTGTLRDLTVDGCQLTTDVALLAGTRLNLTIGEHAPSAGIVRWSENDAIGVLFSRPVPAAIVDAVLQAKPPER